MRCPACEQAAARIGTGHRHQVRGQQLTAALRFQLTHEVARRKPLRLFGKRPRIASGQGDGLEIDAGQPSLGGEADNVPDTMVVHTGDNRNGEHDLQARILAVFDRAQLLGHQIAAANEGMFLRVQSVHLKVDAGEAG